jgi:Uma2 family endonuclease
MATSTIVPLSEYLSKSYRPDCDWIDGELKERNVGERQHASVQKFFIRYFGRREEELDVLVWPEQRVQVSSTRFRVPDITVIRASDPNEAIVTVAPLLCIEILSKDDRMSEIEERAHDYLAMGVPMVWIVDPKTRTAFQKDKLGLEAVEELTLPNQGVQVALAEVFAELDRLEGRA